MFAAVFHGRWPALLANLLVIGTVVYAGALHSLDADLYYRSVQEDEYLEWSTFWAFVGATVLFAMAAKGQRRALGTVPWFPIGVAGFCLLVAMEEISWGQRVLGYRPPRYFLEHNFQQELNLHNVVDTDYREWALASVIIGYGVMLPLVTLWSAGRRLLGRAGIVAPPLALIPAFATTWAIYLAYPWSHSGEWVELMLGVGFLFAGLQAYRVCGGFPDSRRDRLIPVVASWALVIGLGGATAAASRHQRSAHADNVDAARSELAALKQDLLAGQRYMPCNVHKRLYTYVDKYRQSHMTAGEFAALTAQGLPEERAEFFLDPWNSPYWIRTRCNARKRERAAFVYSFGPNRRRESSRESIIEDDVGVIVLEQGRRR